LSSSICLKRAYNFWISFSVNWLGNSVLPIRNHYVYKPHRVRSIRQGKAGNRE
jgi:hypothetical protein